MDIETRQYQNGDLSFVKTVQGKYRLEVFLSATLDDHGNVIPGPYTPEQMILTVYNLPEIHESKTHMVGGFELEGDIITGYGGNEHDKLVVEDKEITDRVRFLIDHMNNSVPPV